MFSLFRSEYRVSASSESVWHAYLLVAIAFLAGGWLRLMLEPFTGSIAGYLYFLPAIVIGAAAGGAGPALVAAVAGTSLGLGLIGQNGLTTREVVFALIFYFNGMFIAAIGAYARNQHIKALAVSNELRSREAHLKSILETVPDAMVVLDENGCIRSFSSAAERIFQWHADEVIGKNLSVIVPRTYTNKKDLNDHDTFGRAIVDRRTIVARRKDGSIFPVQFTIGEVRSLPKLFTAFITDLTSQQEAETRADTLQAELFRISRLNAMGEMATALAHELNQPLSAIVNYYGGIKRTVEHSPQISAASLLPKLEEASEQAIRASEIIRGIRSFVGDKEQEREVIRLETLVSEAIALALVGTDPTKFSVSLEVDHKLNPLLVDKIQIQQVILNLVRNALEAMEEEAKGNLGITGRLADRGLAEIAISDAGAGIMQDVRESLFRPFVTTKTEGMGMGLSICRTIVEAHGGKIWVETNSPNGCIFKFTLPVVAELAHEG